MGLITTKSIGFTGLLMIISMFAIGQTDSLTVAQAEWNVKKIAPGIKLRHFWFNGSLFNSNQNINVLEVRLSRKNTLDIAADQKVLKGTSMFGMQNNAIAAINGTFFDIRNGGSMDYIRSNNIVIHKNRLRKDNVRAAHQKAAVLIDPRKVRIAAWDGSENWEDHLSGTDVMVSGPLLVQNFNVLKQDSIESFAARHPRTALALLKNNKVLLITIDGRNEKAAGMDLFELCKFLKWYQVKDAINLDGGGSTTLWISGQPYGGIINHPSDNKKMEQTSAYRPGMDLDNLPAERTKWDHDGERPVANVILVKRKK